MHKCIGAELETYAEAKVACDRVPVRTVAGARALRHTTEEPWPPTDPYPLVSGARGQGWCGIARHKQVTRSPHHWRGSVRNHEQC